MPQWQGTYAHTGVYLFGPRTSACLYRYSIKTCDSLAMHCVLKLETFLYLQFRSPLWFYLSLLKRAFTPFTIFVNCLLTAKAQLDFLVRKKSISYRLTKLVIYLLQNITLFTYFLQPLMLIYKKNLNVPNKFYLNLCVWRQWKTKIDFVVQSSQVLVQTCNIYILHVTGATIRELF